MINFGAPRIGNVHFKDWTEGHLVNLSAWRFVYRADVIPRATPNSLGFIHAGHLFNIYRKSSEVFYRQIGGGEYRSAPRNWYCELFYSFEIVPFTFIYLIVIVNHVLFYFVCVCFFFFFFFVN